MLESIKRLTQKKKINNDDTDDKDEIKHQLEISMSPAQLQVEIKRLEQEYIELQDVIELDIKKIKQNMEKMEKEQKFEFGEGGHLVDEEVYPDRFYGKNLKFEKEWKKLKQEIIHSKKELPEHQEADINYYIQLKNKLEYEDSQHRQILHQRTLVYELYDDMQRMYEEHEQLERDYLQKQQEYQDNVPEYDYNIEEDYDFREEEDIIK